MLKLLHIVSLYEQLSGEVAADDVTGRTFVFGAKAAPGYRMAKESHPLINAVGATISMTRAPRRFRRLPVELQRHARREAHSRRRPVEQISGGQEASGTSNMKFALNGALTIGTDDGANVEIRELVGDDNFFLFG